MSDTITDLFSVFCEARDHERPLIQHDLTFAQLIDTVVKPFENDEPFFVDGASLKKKDVRRLKVLRQGKNFVSAFTDLHYNLRERLHDASLQRVLGDQYGTRFEALCRETCQDVTAQVLKAFDAEIRPHLRDYLPNRQVLIEAATRVFLETVKFYSGA